ncbi:MAG TPA: helix-turn-helix transcriptional regulator [Candidatus Cottocaccamicrobium excrementipullorum]|nr:helix-turn-helix transcriptional regulator [Candidatus Cottocaccamicrobium excrementipullorum]
MDLSFGEKIKDARKAKGMTQRQLADKIGAKHNSVSDWENNKNKPDPDTIELICGVLDITPNYLLRADDVGYNATEKILINKYRALDHYGQELVDLVLDKEYERCQEQKPADIIQLKEPDRSYLEPEAAHGRTDVSHTQEGKQHDDDIMNDDSEWE